MKGRRNTVMIPTEIKVVEVGVILEDKIPAGKLQGVDKILRKL